MEQIPAESVMVSRAFALLWVLVFSAVLIAGRRWTGAREFREKMLQQWKPALVISFCRSRRNMVETAGTSQRV